MSTKPKQNVPDAIHRPALQKPVARRDRKAKTPNAPGLLHGTRVAFHIDCEKCGTSATLPFVPKTDGALLCPECARSVFGDDWHRGRGRERATIDAACAACGDAFETRMKDGQLASTLCAACRRGDQKAKPGRIGGAVLDPSAGVRKKRPRSTRSTAAEE
jgi:CxxC-x17-CxxC domain-containing protein